MYRIYVKDIKINNLVDKIKKNLTLNKKEIYKLLYSDEGIYKIQNNIVYRGSLKIKNIIVQAICENEVYIDPSITTYSKIDSQMPSNYNLININKFYYKMDNDPDFNFIVIEEDNLIVDAFIETNIPHNKPKVAFMISSFLSL